MAAAREATVLICTRNRPAMLADAVASVLRGDAVPRELLVVDQSEVLDARVSTIGDAKGCRVRYLHSSTSGLSRARNLGLREAACDRVVLIDDDMLVAEDWLDHLLAAAEDGDAAVATGRVLPAPQEGEGLAVPPAALVLREEPAVYRAPQPLDVVPGGNVSVNRQVVLALGGYDERLGAGTRFGGAEDNDMGHRLLAAGHEVRHVPEALSWHRAWRPRREMVALRWRYARGKGAFYAKHAAAGDAHVARRARTDVARRAGRSLRSPRAAAREAHTLAAMAAGAAEWLVREGRA